jgi:hypothetical protein
MRHARSDDLLAERAEHEAHRELGGPVLRVEHRIHLDHIE